MTKMFLMCGLSGAGKTTFAKKFAHENHLLYLSIDDIYASYKSKYHVYNPWEDKDYSFKAWIEFFESIHNAELNKIDVIIDTNAPTRVKRLQFIDWFPTFDEHNLIYIIADRKLRLRNNADRKRVVPYEEMRKMEKEFEAPVILKDGLFIPGTEELEWDALSVYLNQNNELRSLNAELKFF